MCALGFLAAPERVMKKKKQRRIKNYTSAKWKIFGRIENRYNGRKRKHLRWC